jgi:hypothetical protein
MRRGCSHAKGQARDVGRADARVRRQRGSATWSAVAPGVLRDAGAEIRPGRGPQDAEAGIGPLHVPPRSAQGDPHRGRIERSRTRSWCDWMVVLARAWQGEPSGQRPLVVVVLVGGRLGGAARAVQSAASTSTPHSQEPRLLAVGMPVERVSLGVAARREDADLDGEPSS